MVMSNQLKEDNSLFHSGSPQKPKCPGFSFEGVKVPIYHFGPSPVDNGPLLDLSCELEEEQSILDSVLLAQWEDRMFKDHFEYDVTACEIKVIGGRRKFIAQLNEGWNIFSLPKSENSNSCERDRVLLDWIKDNDNLLFCVTSSKTASCELIPSAAVPSDAILAIPNATPVEYGHIFLVPCRSYSLCPFLDARSLEMFTRVAVHINNCSFRLFYDYCRPTASFLYFQACYFSNPLAVELMPVVPLYCGGPKGISISSVIDYPIKTLLFESNCNLKLMVGVLAEICSSLLQKGIPYNLLITECGKKIFLFLQKPNPGDPCYISAWECGGYFLYKSRNEFDQATEEAMMKRLSTFSLDDDGFQAVKQLCFSIAKQSTLC